MADTIAMLPLNIVSLDVPRFSKIGGGEFSIAKFSNNKIDNKLEIIDKLLNNWIVLRLNTAVLYLSTIRWRFLTPADECCSYSGLCIVYNKIYYVHILTLDRYIIFSNQHSVF